MTETTGVDLAVQIATVARSVPGVADLHGGVFGEVATYLPGGRVAGVRIAEGHVEIHLSLFWDHPVRATADTVRTTVEPLVDRPVHVTVQDIVRPEAGPDTRPLYGAQRLTKENS
ncbi:hypothetical protein [Kribbella qitaiheensis]|uniref:hypothetical protein n=1 Tax=Kribbella qitaiheensis TaxID=1544730 RepID=UPI0019D4F9C0|nr:hypothetical protein [Kribbella qitaiheensis]